MQEKPTTAVPYNGPRVYPEFCVNVLRECKQQKLV